MALAWMASGVRAESPPGTFYRAYYLEHAQRDYAAAAELYQRAARQATEPELRSRAQAGWLACREEIAAADLARLMPPDPIVYIELSRPADRVMGLLEQMGLLGGSATTPSENQVAVSPTLVRELLGIRGAALAVTGFDSGAGMPSGVLVLHPGDVEIVRGLIETVLPAEAEPAEPIADYPTYRISDGPVDTYVTLTTRLVIASTQWEQNADVVQRLLDPDVPSLATQPELADELSGRNSTLLYFLVNPEPVRPLLRLALAAGGAQSHEAALAQALLDIDSLQAITGRFDLGPNGVALHLSVRLAEDHRNLLYNLTRLPPVERETFRSVPSGVAALAGFALNEAGASPAARNAKTHVVTALDFGREIFANMRTVSLFVLPPESGTTPGPNAIPDVAATIAVNDVAHSRALWSQVLGLTSLASGSGPLEGTICDIQGTSARAFKIEDVTIYLASTDNGLIVSPSRSAVARSISAMRNGSSVLDDDVFAKALRRVGKDTTLLALAAPARCLRVAAPYMSERERKEARPLMQMLEHTIVSFVLTQSHREWRLSAELSGVPDVGELLNHLAARATREESVARPAAITASRGSG